MSHRYHISPEQKEELETARKTNQDKKVDRRLRALILRADGAKCAQVAKECEYNADYVSELTRIYCTQGLSAIVENHYKGNRRNMSFAEEAELLASFESDAEQGRMIEISAIKQVYEEKVGHEIGSAQIYRVLARHGWRKVMPRSKHPQKASDEAIEASKKLTRMCWKNVGLSTSYPGVLD